MSVHVIIISIFGEKQLADHLTRYVIKNYVKRNDNFFLLRRVNHQLHRMQSCNIPHRWLFETIIISSVRHCMEIKLHHLFLCAKPSYDGSLHTQKYYASAFKNGFVWYWNWQPSHEIKLMNKFPFSYIYILTHDCRIYQQTRPGIWICCSASNNNDDGEQISNNVID